MPNVRTKNLFRKRIHAKTKQHS